ncbi:MAG: cyclic nucleotide-gated ion channel, partial [Pseudomonadota bacterium]
LALDIFNAISVFIFTIEYVLSLWSCVEVPMLHALPKWRARLNFAFHPLLIIDLLAIAPFYLSFLFNLDLRVLRILRLFRFLKLARYSPGLVALGRVLRNERRALYGALLVMGTLLIFASTGIYFIEREAQPEAFGSIPAAAWWALATLTTVGYGDVVPITHWGKVFGGLMMIFGLGMFALPIGILATGFSREANRREFVISWGMVASVPIFAQLNAKTVAQIGALLYSRTYHSGQPIVHIGEDADAMFIIASGEVAVDLDDEQVRLGEGEFFGEMALLYRRRREHNVTAVSNCRLLVLEKSDFESLCHREPELLSEVRKIAEERLKDDKSGRVSKSKD